MSYQKRFEVWSETLNNTCRNDLSKVYEAKQKFESRLKGDHTLTLDVRKDIIETVLSMNMVIAGFEIDDDSDSSTVNQRSVEPATVPDGKGLDHLISLSPLGEQADPEVTVLTGDAKRSAVQSLSAIPGVSIGTVNLNAGRG